MDDQTSPEPAAERDRLPAVLGGLTIMVVGVALLLGELGVLGPYGGWGAWWPLLLIGMGAAKLARTRDPGCRDGGGLVLIGAWLLVNQLGILAYRTSWPLLLVGIGGLIMWQALSGSPRGGRHQRCG